MDALVFITDWFKQNCDGDWEHNHSISLTTLDNPGWSFSADITDTELEGKRYNSKSFISDNDWLDVKSDGNAFTAFGDSSKLATLLQHFRAFVESEN